MSMDEYITKKEALRVISDVFFETAPTAPINSPYSSAHEPCALSRQWTGCLTILTR